MWARGRQTRLGISPTVHLWCNWASLPLGPRIYPRMERGMVRNFLQGGREGGKESRVPGSGPSTSKCRGMAAAGGG